MVDTLVVSMNIKNPEAHRLAKEIIAITGESVTEAVIVALRDRLERIERLDGRPGRTLEQRLERIRAITMDTAAMMAGGPDAIHATDFLYDDESGLPQ